MNDGVVVTLLLSTPANDMDMVMVVTVGELRLTVHLHDGGKRQG